MKPLHFFSLLATTALLPLATSADEIHLSEKESPDEVVVYYMNDMQNQGEIAGPNFAGVEEASVGFHIGDLGDAANPGHMRKNFLMFHLSSLGGKKVTNATLRLFLSKISHEAEEKPLPPAWLFHAEKWNDAAWLSDPRGHGLQNQHFSDKSVFTTKLPLCGPDDQPGVIELDVTGMIQSDYQRNPEPVAVFRLEISDFEALDIADSLPNAYRFVGTGSLNQAEKTPTLILSFED